MTDLRADLIEAGARAFFSDEWNDFDALAPSVQDALRDDTEKALDAVLDVLADRASCSSYEAAIRTHGKSPAVCSHTTLDGLIAALRIDYLTEEE